MRSLFGGLVARVALLSLIPGIAEAAPESWFVKRDVALQGVRFHEAAAYFTLLTEVPIEVDSKLTNVYVTRLKVKQKSVDEMLSVLAEANDLIVKPTSKGGFRITQRNPGDLQKITVPDAAPKLNVVYANADSASVLLYLQELNPELNVLDFDGFRQQHTFSGSANAEEIINDLAETEGLSVFKRDGIIYFKKAP